MLSYTTSPGYISVFLAWRNKTIKVYLYLCRNTTRDLKREVEYRRLTSDDSVAIIPKSLIETPLQLIQAALFYEIYRVEIKRVRNKGLLLAMLALGKSQISQAVESLSNLVEKGDDYYLLGVNEMPQNTTSCTPLEIPEELDVNDLKPLVKNTMLITSLL